MKIDTNILESHEAKLTVTVDSEKFEGSKRQAARQLSKKYKIAGFRPGKAPYAVVAKHIGEGAIVEQAVNNLVDEIYPQVIEEAEIKPYGPGSLENMPEMDPPTFEFLVPLEPEVTLSNYRETRIEFTPKEVTEENINEVLDNLRDSQAKIEAVERPIEEGDMVYIVLNGTRKGEEDPEKKTLVEDRRYPVIVEKEGVGDENEYPFPGFSRKLLGLSAGDKKKFQHTFSSEYEFEDLRGVTGMYKVSIEEVKGRALPELTDEFAQSVGEYETLEALKDDIRSTLTEQFENEARSEYETAVVDQLVEEAAFKYPPQMLEAEIDDFIHDLEHQLSHQGITIDVYLQSRAIEMQELRDEVKENAEGRMKRGLLLMEVANQESVTISNEVITQRVQQTLNEVAQYYSEEEAKRLSTGDNLSSLMSRIATDEIISNTLTLLREIASGELEKREAEEAEAAAKAEAEAQAEQETTTDEESAEETQESEPTTDPAPETTAEVVEEEEEATEEQSDADESEAEAEEAK